MNLLICGAHGFLGRTVTELALRRGHQVTALTRRETAAPRAGGVYRALDLAEAAEWAKVPKQPVDAVIYAAGRAHIRQEGEANREEFLRSNVHGVRNALEFASRAGARRFVLASSTAVYGWEAPGVRTEATTPAPTSIYGESKLAGEQACAGFQNLDLSILRLATLFGEGDQGNILSMARAIRRRRFFIPGATGCRKSVLPVDLAAQVILDQAERAAHGTTLLNVALPEAPTLRQICDAFERHCGFPRVPTVGTTLSRLAGWGGDAAKLLWRDVPFSSAVRRKVNQATEVDTRRLYGESPASPPPPFETWMAGYADYYRRA